MNCSHHPEKKAVTVCGLCGTAYCAECLVNLGDQHYCKDCLAAGINKAGSMVVSKDRKSRFWAFVFSMVPGVGYLYLGLLNKGLQTMTLFFGTIFVASFIGFGEITGLVVPVVMFYSIFDTQQLVKSINEGIPVEDKQFFDFKKLPLTQSWIGYALVVIGFMALSQNVLSLYMPDWLGHIRRFVPPLLIIGLGAVILYRNTKRTE